MIIQNKISELNVDRRLEAYCAIIDDPTGQAIRDKMHRQIQELMLSLGDLREDVNLVQKTVA